MRTTETARFYDVAHSGLTADRDSYVELAREEGGPICEMGAGTGRVALAVAAAGAEVVGVDVSEPMLARFREKAATLPPQLAARVQVAAGDMRSWGPDAFFQQVFMPFRVLLALTRRQERHACLVNCRRILRPGGRLALNVFHPCMAVMRQFSGEAEGSWREVGVWPTPEGTTLELMHTARYDHLRQLVHTRFRWSESRTDGSTVVTEEPIEIAYLWRDELVLHLEHAGFEIESLWGGFDRSSLTADDQEMVVTARPGRAA